MKISITVAMVVALATIATASSLLGSSKSSAVFREIHGKRARYFLHYDFLKAAGKGEISAKNYTVTKASYVVPDVVLTDRFGKKVQLADMLAQPHPVLLQFIFTSCTTICPILSATFSQAQSDLATVSKDYQMISITIDPEYDTPGRLDAYARRYRPTANWIFLTGRKEDIHRVLQAFDALYQSDNKMYHKPYTYLRSRTGVPWARLEGYLKVSELLSEYRGTLDSAGLKDKQQP